MFKSILSYCVKVTLRQINKTPTKQFRNSNKFHFHWHLKAKHSNTLSNFKAKQNIYILLTD